MAPRLTLATIIALAVSVPAGGQQPDADAFEEALRRSEAAAKPAAGATGMPVRSSSPGETTDDFEAALRAMPRPANPPSGVRPAAAASPARKDGVGMAPPSLLPARFRTPLKGFDGLGTATQAANAGELDPLAFIEHQVGPIPLLPGVRQLRCGPDDMRVLFTLGIDASPEYRRALDDYAASFRARTASPAPGPGVQRRQSPQSGFEARMAFGRIRELQDAAKKNPAVRTRMSEMARLLQSKGFVLWTGGALPMWRLAKTEPFTPAIDILFNAGPLAFIPKCAAAGVQVPAGPLFSVHLSITDPYWRKDIVANPDFR